MSEPLVELAGITREFAGPPPLRPLDRCSLTVGDGEHVAIVGPSGSGKSTLLNILGLLDSPSHGRYRLAGVDTGPLSQRARTALRASAIGFVFQSFHLLGERPVLDNVVLGMIYTATAPRERRRRALDALARVGLAERAGSLPRTLSGGEQQRVAIARAIATQPRLVLCDEPTGNLDSWNAAEVLALFDELTDDGVTLVVVTHDPVVADRAPRRVRIADGTVTEL